MITIIGLVAGEIWNYLEQHGKLVKTGDLVAGLQKDRDTVMMSVGWLAREGHIVLEGDAPNYTLRLT
jgi:hypothetical protein